jgi:hypothetical protein
MPQSGIEDREAAKKREAQSDFFASLRAFASLRRRLRRRPS